MLWFQVEPLVGGSGFAAFRVLAWAGIRALGVRGLGFRVWGGCTWVRVGYCPPSNSLY